MEQWFEVGPHVIGNRPRSGDIGMRAIWLQSSIPDLNAAFTRPERPNGVVIAYYQSSLVIHYLVEYFPAKVYNLPPTPDPTQQPAREGA